MSESSGRIIRNSQKTSPIGRCRKSLLPFLRLLEHRDHAALKRKETLLDEVQDGHPRTANAQSRGVKRRALLDKLGESHAAAGRTDGLENLALEVLRVRGRHDAP